MRELALAALLLAAPGSRLPDPGQLALPAQPDAQGLLRVDPIYFRIASETGGDFYFWDPGEFPGAGLHLPLPGDAVALAYGTFRGQALRIAIPVESGVTRLSVFAGAQRKDQAVLRRPDGRAVAGTAAGEALQSYRHMAIATVERPDPGIWHLELRGVGLYSVSATIAPAHDGSAPAFDRLEFVEMGGRPGHEGWFPIQREPRKGETLECSVHPDGSFSAPEFSYVAVDGSALGQAELRREENGGDYYGRCVLPSTPFRVRVTGLDAQGRRFQRIESGLHTPR